MVKTKEAPWTEQKTLYKDGNVDVYRKFGWETWRRMTEDERAMWTELNESTPAPISKEVIEFEKKESEVTEVTHPVSTENPEVVATYTNDEPLTIHNDVEAARTLLKAELKERGIRFSPNSKLETLKKKLADADNPE